ncbi:MATE family efflux transporter [Deinococcus aquiradiocola]|uniref:Multidrug-efflux transporter n=1 Tax=Deinococcus aquiradiocola TaxID=393059 RepID=A0A917PEX0_9DEIO|nr:MATE family efflux transporter [Deinococcus aquiradiocola]GGJ73832.1 MATE family efflux transporter [Deinococcus aquiradiocola]
MSAVSPARTPTPPPPSPGREIARIAVPVSLEFTLMLVLNFVNQVVVGALGATAIAAVGFASSLTFIVIVTLGALGSSVSILVARASGAGRRSDMNTSVGAALLLASVLTAIVSVPLVLFAPQLLHLTGASDGVAAAGSTYLRLTSLALVPAVLGAVLSGVMRSLGHARSPMVATFVTVVLNTLLGYALVFGVGPLPRLGVAGAGWATLVTAVLKTAILLAQLYSRGRLATWALPRHAAQWRAVLGPLFVLAVPLGITELAWSGGTFLYNVVFQRLGDEALAAAQIVNTLEGVFIVGSLGLMSATTALVGRALGRGDAPGAVSWVQRLLRTGLQTGAAFGLLFALSALLLGVLFGRAGADVQHLAAIGILINAAFQVVKVRNMIVGAGILPSGNDTGGVIMGDVIGAFVVGLPLAVLLGLYTPLGVTGVFLARVIEECVKMAVFAWRAGRLRWDVLAAEQSAVQAG